MPNASKYIIDVANIRPGGKPIKGLYVGSSEKKYATLGNKCIYDKVLYELSINNITNVEPNAQTVTISSYTSKRTHGNGAVDTLYINPSTKQVTANTSTANTKDTTVVVNQALTLNGTTTGTGVTVTITQMKDYPIGLTLTISPKSTIPASGGSISSALTNYTYSVKANYKSGNNNVDVTSNAATKITANVTGVTASSKGTTASNTTTAGTIRFTASYTCNGKTVTTTTDVNITQDKNEVVSYANPTFTLTPSSNQTLPASGGSVTASVSNVQQVRTWSSTSTDTFTPSSNTTWTAQTISCNSRGTVTGGTLTLGTTTATVTANGKSTTKSYVVYQQANAVTNSDYSASNHDYWASCSIGDGLTAAYSSASVSASAGHTHVYYYYYDSKDTSGPYYSYPSDGVSTSMIRNDNSRFSYSNGTITHSSMADNVTTDTVTIRATNNANTSATGDASKSISNDVTTTWGDITVTVPSNQSVTSTIGSITLTSSNTSALQTRSDKYTSGTKKSTAIRYTPDSNWKVSSNDTGFTTGLIIVSGSFIPRISWGENTSTSPRSATITVSYTANGKTGSNSFTITQEGASAKYYNINYSLGGNNNSNEDADVEVWMGKESETNAGTSQDSQICYAYAEDSISDAGDLNATADTAYVNFGCDVNHYGNNCSVKVIYGTYKNSGNNSAYIKIPTSYISPSITAQVTVNIS